MSAGTLLVRSQVPDLFDSRLPYLYKILYENLDAPTLTYPAVCQVLDSDRMKEQFSEITGFAQFVKKPEGEPLTYDKVLQGFDQEFKHDTWAKGYMLSFESMEDDIDGPIRNATPALARVARNSIETEIFSTFNLAFTTATASDGQPLIDTTHKMAGGGTISNLITGDISQGAIEDALNYYSDVRDDRNQHVDLYGRIILSHWNNQWVLHEILQSQLRSDTANNASNALNQIGIQPVFTKYLTDTDMWFMMADPEKLPCVVVFWRREPFSDSMLDFETRSMKVGMFYRMSHGAVSWRPIVGSTGTP